MCVVLYSVDRTVLLQLIALVAVVNLALYYVGLLHAGRCEIL